MAYLNNLLVVGMRLRSILYAKGMPRLPCSWHVVTRSKRIMSICEHVLSIVWVRTLPRLVQNIHPVLIYTRHDHVSSISAVFMKYCRCAYSLYYPHDHVCWQTTKSTALFVLLQSSRYMQE